MKQPVCRLSESRPGDGLAVAGNLEVEDEALFAGLALPGVLVEQDEASRRID